MAESPGNTCWCLQRNGRREGLTHGAGRCVGLHQVCNGLPSDQPQPTVHTNLLSAACGSQSFIVASALDAVDLVRRTQAQLIEQSLLILGKQLGEGSMVMTHLQTAVVQGPGPQSALKDGSVYRNVDALVNPHALFDVPWTLNLGGVRSERFAELQSGESLAGLEIAVTASAPPTHRGMGPRCPYIASAWGIVSRPVPVASRRSRSRTRRVASKCDGFFHRVFAKARPSQKARANDQAMFPSSWCPQDEILATWLTTSCVLTLVSSLCSTMVWGRRRCRRSCSCQCLAVCESLGRCPNLG